MKRKVAKEKTYHPFQKNDSLTNEGQINYYHKMDIPKTLTDICNFLIQQNMKLSSQFEDGRINASLNESELLNEIKNNFNVQIPKSRAWFDFAVETNTEFLPVNIKVTDTTHADNLNCKLGIYYALTGLLPIFPNEVNWLTFFEKLKENLGKDESKDYYFLVVNKKDTKDIFINALKGLQELQANGNNLPFQCKWETNKLYHKRSFSEAKEFVLSVFGKSIKLRAEMYFQFKRFFPEYV